MTHDRGTLGPNFDKGLLISAVWFGLLGGSLLNVAPAVICAYPERPRREHDAVKQHN